MRQPVLILVVLFAPTWTDLVLAVDLTKIDRPIAKEPAYTNQPEYCLLVFGAEAKGRVWLVRDGDVIYVDRNGNGDLTEEEERSVMSKSAQWPGGREWRPGDLLGIGGKPQYTDLKVVSTGDRRYFIRLKTQNKVAWTAWGDASGPLRFANRPQDAPLVHFDGPLTIGLWNRPEYRPGGEPILVEAAIGTPGLGPGTFASFDEHENFAIGMTGTIVFANKDIRADPIRVDFGLGRSG